MDDKQNPTGHGEKLRQAIEKLRDYNAWRRGADLEPPAPAEIGEAIELVCGAAREEAVEETKKAPDSVTLTVDQIKDLAEMAGLRVEGDITDDDRETEITVETCPPDGVDDEGTMRHYRHIAYYDEYPGEGVYPLGPEIRPNARNEPTGSSCPSTGISGSEK